MPASKVMPEFKAGKLHSGSKHGPVVTDKAQAQAIEISEARAEGHHIPPPPDHHQKGAMTHQHNPMHHQHKAAEAVAGGMNSGPMDTGGSEY